METLNYGNPNSRWFEYSGEMSQHKKKELLKIEENISTKKANIYWNDLKQALKPSGKIFFNYIEYMLL